MALALEAPGAGDGTALMLAGLAWGDQASGSFLVALPACSAGSQRLHVLWLCDQLDQDADRSLSNPWDLPTAFGELRNQPIWKGGESDVAQARIVISDIARSTP